MSHNSLSLLRRQPIIPAYICKSFEIEFGFKKKRKKSAPQFNAELTVGAHALNKRDI